MNLVRLTIRSAPGISHPFAIREIAPGLNLMVGPNGSGKSTLRRAVRDLLWPETNAATVGDVEALFTHEGDEFFVRREGSDVSWQKNGEKIAAPNFGAAHLADCFSLGITDLAIEKTQENQELAETIRRELSGGHDLAALFEDFRPVRSSKNRRIFSAAEAAVRKLEKDFQDLAQDEDGRAVLEEKIHAAQAAEVRARLLEKALEIANWREDLRGLEARLANLPASLEQFTGREEEELEECELRLEKEKRELADLDEQIRDAIARRDAARLPAPLPATELKARRAAANELHQLESRNGEAARACEEKRVALEAAREALGRTAPRQEDSVLSTEALGTLEQAARAVLEARAHHEAAQQLVDRLRAATGATPEARTEDIPAAVTLLRRWLGTAEPAPGRVLSATGLLGGLLALGAFLWSLAGGPQELPTIAAAGAALLLLILATRGLWPPTARNQIRSSFDETATAAPETWEPESVRRRLAELERQAAENLARSERDQENATSLRNAEADLARTEPPLRESWERLRSVAREIGITPEDEILLAPLVLANRLHAEESARRLLAEAQARSTKLQEDFQRSFDVLARWLADHGYPRPGDTGMLQASLEELCDRSSDHEHASSELLTLQGRRENRTQDVQDAEQALRDFYEDRLLSAGDRNELLRLLDSFPVRRKLSERIRDLQSRIADNGSYLDSEPALLATPSAELDAELRQARDQAATVPELIDQSSRIKERVATARSQTQLAEALAARDAAAEKLRAERDERLHRGAARFLLDEVVHEHESEEKPQIVRSAEDYFGAFTHNAFALKPPKPGTEGSFRAQDLASGRGLELSELSDGTRIQLLLAVRLAFVKHSEKNGPLPLFLDETLSTADLDRLGEITAGLRRLAEEGRQIFYLTANSNDVKTWQDVSAGTNSPPAEVIDLGRIRGQAALPEDISSYVPPQRESLPEPNGLSPAAYAKELAVPAADLRGPADALPLYYLLTDDLDLLYRVQRDFKFNQLGPWEGLRNSMRSHSLIEEQEGLALDARVRCARAIFRACRVGRGKRVDRLVLESAGEANGIGERWVAPFAELAAELEGDAGSLLRELRDGKDPRRSRYRTSHADKFAAWLEANEYLDLNTPLGIEEVRARMLRDCSTDLGSGAISPETCHAILDQLLQSGEHGGEVGNKAGAAGALE